MANNTRSKIIRKLDRIPSLIENAQQHAIDCIATYLELAGNTHTLEDFLNPKVNTEDHRYHMQIDGLIVILHLTENALEQTTTIIDLLKQM